MAWVAEIRLTRVLFDGGSGLNLLHQLAFDLLGFRWSNVHS
jgi:hypothetical protein